MERDHTSQLLEKVSFSDEEDVEYTRIISPLGESQHEEAPDNPPEFKTLTNQSPEPTPNKRPDPQKHEDGLTTVKGT